MAREVNLPRLEATLAQFDITLVKANDLVTLQDYRVAILADDSGSMKNRCISDEEWEEEKKKPIDDKERELLMRLLSKHDRERFDELSEEEKEDLLMAQRLPPTRFQEVERACKFLVEVCGCFGPVDIFFMNRGAARNVLHTTDAAFEKAFQLQPRGTTPMMDRLKNVVNACVGELPVLLFILTDGAPDSDEQEKQRMKDYLLKAVSETRANGGVKVKVQIMTCTDNYEDTAWLDDIENQHDCIDAIDDYKTELEQVIRAGHVREFTVGDWVIKAILGPLDKAKDILDEDQLQRVKRQAKEKIFGGSNCVIS